MTNTTLLEIYTALKNLAEGILHNTATIKTVEEVSQVAARTSMMVAMKMQILAELCVNSLTNVEKAITSLNSTQTVILESLAFLNSSVMYSLILGITNTAAILILLCIIIVLNYKIRKLK